MHIKFPFDISKPVMGEASIEINKPIQDVFSYIGEHFFENYPKWSVEVVEFEPLDGREVFVGAKAKQVRKDSGAEVESVFEIVDYQPVIKLIFRGLTEPYKHSYLLESSEQKQPLSNTPLRRVVMAQDTGSAITGAVRADYFWGWGEQAEAQAGRMKQPLRLWALWPLAKDRN